MKKNINFIKKSWKNTNFVKKKSPRKLKFYFLQTIGKKMQILSKAHKKNANFIKGYRKSVVNYLYVILSTTDGASTTPLLRSANRQSRADLNRF